MAACTAQALLNVVLFSMSTVVLGTVMLQGRIDMQRWYLSAGEWLAKLQRYSQAEEIVVRTNPKKATAANVAVQAEGERVLKALKAQVTLAHAHRSIPASGTFLAAACICLKAQIYFRPSLLHTG